MGKININAKKNKIARGTIILSLIIFVIAISLLFVANSNQRLNTKLNEYAKKHGISIEDIKKDKMLMSQIQMEADREEKIDTLIESIEVTKEEIANYRSMIGSSMNIKKSVFILFDNAADCEKFIAEHGNDEAPDKAGIGIVPLMESDGQRDFYNIAGKTQLETVFDTLKDGEYSKTPIEFSGMFCYLKRIEISSPIERDEDLINYIKNEKAQAQLQKQGG